MSRNREEPFLEILEVTDGVPSPYAKIDITLGGEKALVRWGIDDFTYPHLKRALQTRPFDAMPGVQYHYFLLLSYASEFEGPRKLKNFSAFLECRSGQETKNLQFRCSEYFAGNIEWFKKVRSLKEVSHVLWDQNVPSNTGVHTDAQASGAPVTPTR